MTSPAIPIIGISSSLLTIESGALRGRERAFVGQDYVHAISRAGGIPIILPTVKDEVSIARQVNLIDGLVLSGGYDVHPHFYGEEPHRLLEASYPDRDHYEIQLTLLAHQYKKPILGICRGIQLINVAFGGTIYQDISLHGQNILQHHQAVRVDHEFHTVNVEKGSKLSQILNCKFIKTNSLHHQAVRLLAPGFCVNATTQDGIIEGIEKVDGSFILGVQWHPELMFEKDPMMLKLFEALLNASAKKGN